MTSLQRRKLLCLLLGHRWRNWVAHIRECDRCFRSQHQHLHILRNGIINRRWVDDRHRSK